MKALICPHPAGPSGAVPDPSVNNLEDLRHWILGWFVRLKVIINRRTCEE